MAELVERAKRKELRNRTYEAAMRIALERGKDQHIANVEVRQVALGIEAAMDVLEPVTRRVASLDLKHECCRPETPDGKQTP